LATADGRMQLSFTWSPDGWMTHMTMVLHLLSSNITRPTGLQEPHVTLFISTCNDGSVQIKWLGTSLIGLLLLLLLFALHCLHSLQTKKSHWGCDTFTRDCDLSKLTNSAPSCAAHKTFHHNHRSCVKRLSVMTTTFNKLAIALHSMTFVSCNVIKPAFRRSSCAICDFPRENGELQLEQELSRQSDSKIGTT
jgi:hypothetical protein